MLRKKTGKKNNRWIGWLVLLHHKKKDLLLREFCVESAYLGYWERLQLPHVTWLGINDE